MDKNARHPIYTKYGIDANDNIITLKNQRLHRINIRYGSSYRFVSISVNKKKRHISAARFIYECKTQKLLPRTHVIYVVGNRLIPYDIRAYATIDEAIRRSENTITCENIDILASPTVQY